MKTITIIGAKEVKITDSLLSPTSKDLVIDGEEDMSVSDGYHLMEELYEHRITLYIALAKQLSLSGIEPYAKGSIWRSKLHSDGSSFEGWFILGIRTDKGFQITYHLPVAKWDECYFAETLDKAPEFDGHTSQNVLERLKKL